jgi:hypothetical protein
MDNLSSHKRASVQVLIEAAGATPALSSALQPRLQPNRECLLTPQGPAPQSGQTHRQWPVELDRQTRRYLSATRARQLLQILQVRARMIEKRWIAFCEIHD